MSLSKKKKFNHKKIDPKRKKKCRRNVNKDNIPSCGSNNPEPERNLTRHETKHTFFRGGHTSFLSYISLPLTLEGKGAHGEVGGGREGKKKKKNIQRMKGKLKPDVHTTKTF